LPSHPKDWNQTWFYCKDMSPADENPLPGYHVERLDPKHTLPEKLTAAERKKIAPTIAKVKALLGNGLTGVDLVRCWVSWWIIPLSRRTGLMCTYSGNEKDPLRPTSAPLTGEALNEMVKSVLNEDPEDSELVGLAPFCKLNPPPDVSLCTLFTFTSSHKYLINSTIDPFYRLSRNFGKWYMTTRLLRTPGLPRKPKEKPPRRHPRRKRNQVLLTCLSWMTPLSRR
jgi:hypothetical protein